MSRIKDLFHLLWIDIHKIEERLQKKHPDRPFRLRLNHGPQRLTIEVVEEVGENRAVVRCVVVTVYRGTGRFRMHAVKVTGKLIQANNTYQHFLTYATYLPLDRSGREILSKKIETVVDWMLLPQKQLSPEYRRQKLTAWQKLKYFLWNLLPRD